MAQLDEAKLKQIAISLWRQGGMDTLVKVVALGRPWFTVAPVGYCTTFKYIVGRTPGEMEDVVGLRRDSKLAAGADIYLVRPLPQPSEFRLSGYTNTPEGVSTTIKPAHVDYPPGLGAPQWELTSVPPSSLQLLASVGPGQIFRYAVNALPPPI
jgi:hypothetical protein